MEQSDIVRLVERTVAEMQLVTVAQFTKAITELKSRMVSEYQLQETNAAVQKEANAREEHERRLARLESDVQAIDSKVAQVLTTMTAIQAEQTTHYNDVRLLAKELQSVSQVSETLLEMSKQRQVTTNHLLSTQETHSALLKELTDEGADRAEEMVRMENAISTLQQAVVNNQNKLDDIVNRLEMVHSGLHGITVMSTVLTSKRVQSVLLGSLLLLISSAFNIDLSTIVETVIHLMGG